MKLKHLSGAIALFGLVASAHAATDYPSGYTKCVQNTGATCTMTGTHTVALGKAGAFVYATKTGSFACIGTAFPANSFTTSAWCSVGPTASASSSVASSVTSSVATSSVASSAAANGKQVEKLNRGVVAIYTGSGVFVSWRALGTDAAGTTFNVYRGTTKLNGAALSGTNYSDASGTASSSYTVKPVVGGVEQTANAAEATWSTIYKTVKIQKPQGGTLGGVAYTYEANDGAPADLDGDGKYEIVVKWLPTNAKDNAQAGYTGNTYIDAYKLDGTRLWRIDLGRNIRAGAHYTTFLVYDFDGDGKAEVMMKTADATIDGKGVVIGNKDADYRNKDGYILTGPEYFTVFNGLTGAAMATTNYIPARGTVGDWGDTYGNRVDRFLGTVAYLDGKRPSAVFARGYYTRAVLAAWDWRGGKLTNRWTYDSTFVKGTGAYGQGSHYMTVGDVNGDGKDDLVYGAATIGSDGKLLYSTKLCHGDALHLGDHNPNRAGQEVFMVHEEPGCYGNNGMEMHDAATGKILWGVPGSGADVGRGVCFDIDPAHAGNECWSTVGGLMSSAGVQISATHPGKYNFAIWWDGDLSRESLDQTLIDKWVPSTASFARLLTAYSYDAASNNGTKATPVLSADLFGDWREEVVFRNTDSTSLLIFSTTAPTTYKIPTLMHNPQYRAQVAGQNTAYNQPPHPSYFIGNGMGAAVQPPIYTP